jgi:hypothetical protein
MRRAVLVLWAGLAVPLGAQRQQSADREAAVGVRRTGLPAGWTIRLDDKERRSTADDTRFEIMGAGYHVTSGPAALYYRDVHRPTGSFTVRASLTQMLRPTRAEAYGIFIGGRALETPAQEYLYFLVRRDGKYFIAHRAGANVHQIVPWTDHIAVKKEEESGKQSNELAIRVTGDSVHMMVNSHRVRSFAMGDLQGFVTDGQVGLRVNHGLDIHVGTLEIRDD